jgi:hypothetical protein
VTTILACGQPPSPARLHKLLDAAITRLDLTELATIAGDPCDELVGEWNGRRYRLVRYYLPPIVADVALVFPGWSGDLSGVGRIIYVEAK